MTSRGTHSAADGRWATAAQIAMSIGEEQSLVGIEAHALESVMPLLGADAAAIYVTDEHGNGPRLLTQRGFSAGLARASTEAAGMAAHAATNGEPQTVAPIPEDWTVASAPPVGASLRGAAAFPLLARGQTVGALLIATRSPLGFDPSTIDIAEYVAHALGSSILSVRVVEAERRMRNALQAVDEATLAVAAEIEPRRVLQAIVDQAREIAGARYAALGIGTDPERPFDPWVFSGIDEAQAKLMGHYPRPVGLLNVVQAEGRMVRLRDITADPRFRGWPEHHPPMGSFLGVPIRAGNDIVGHLYLTDKIGASEFSTEDERAVASLAAHAAIAYRHARLYEQAQIQRNRLQAVVEHSPLGIVFVEKGSDFTFGNPAAEALFGQQIAPSAGREQYLPHFMAPDGEPVEFDSLPSTRAMRGEPVVGTELLLRRPDGREIPILVSAAPISDATGDITGAVVLWQDITPLKLEQLREEFVSLVAHELRAPITVIAGYADLLSRRDLEERDRRSAEVIRVSTRRLNRMVQDLLDASRIEARRLQLQRRPVQLETLVRDLVDRLGAVLTNHPVRVLAVEHIPVVEADPGRIEQVLTNLLTNAAKYSSAGTEIAVTLSAPDGEVAVAVHNEGPGIPPEDIPRLFTRFYRTHSAQRSKAKGLGLGLHIARGLVEAHGGRIWVDSEPGAGVTFTFALPAASVGEEAAEKVDAIANSP